MIAFVLVLFFHLTSPTRFVPFRNDLWTSRRMLSTPEGTLCKPSSESELLFYAFSEGHPFATYIPKPIAIRPLPKPPSNSDSDRSDFKSCVEMENVLAGFKRPNVLFVKLGRKVSYIYASTSFLLGLCVLDMHVWNGTGYVKYLKHHGMQLTPLTLLRGVMHFVESRNLMQQAQILSVLEGQLMRLIRVLKEEQGTVALTGPKLVIAYEGDDERIREREGQVNVVIKMVNFEDSSIGNVTLGRRMMTQESGDTAGVLLGLRNLVALVREAKKLATYQLNGFYSVPWSA